MAEVYTIAGSNGLGAVPPGWAVTKKGNYGAPGNKRHPAAIALQAAIVSLGRVVKDPALSNLGVDGFIGNETAQALSRALSTHLGPGQLQPEFRASFTPEGIAQNAKALTDLIEKEVVRRGGKVGTVVETVPDPVKVPTKDPLPGPSPGMSMAAWGALGLGVVIFAAGLYFALTSGKGGGGTKRKALADGGDFGGFDEMP